MQKFLREAGAGVATTIECFAVLAALATIAALAARLWWPFELLAHFPLQYAIATAPGAIVFACRRHFVLAVVVTCCFFWNSALLAPSFFSNSPRDADGDVVRVLAANVQTSNRAYERFMATVRDIDPDILLVIEVDRDWLKALEPLHQSFPNRHAAPRQDNFGISVFSKYPMEEARTEYLGAADVPTVVARLPVRGQSLSLIGTHPLPPLGANAALRNEQLAEVARLAQEMETPLVVAGDLNITPWSPYFRDLLRVAELRDSRRGFGIHPTWPSELGPLGIPIDHVLISSDVVVTHRHVAEPIGSDHLPVVVEFDIRR